jgi:hypothetical protein
MKTITTSASPLQPDLLTNIIKWFQSTTLYQLGNDQFQKLSSPNSSFSSRASMNNFKKNFKKQYVYLLPVLLVGLVILISIVSFLGKQTTDVKGAQDQRVAINKPLAVEELNKSYSYSLTDGSDKKIKIKFEFQSCELRDQIVVKGSPAVAIKGRVFLVCNLKLVNDSTTGVAMRTSDYVRLIVDNNSDRLAPDIHNDPVQIQPISTKLTRLGFAIDDTAKKLQLQVGEINGKKDTFELHLQ